MQLRGRVAKNDLHYYQVSAIVIMAVFFVLVDIALLLDVVFMLVSGVFPSVASFFVWIFLFLALYSAYRGFFSK